jgi:ubiquinone/menaquinone biosynthesis C-methylase UbiE
MAEQSNRNPADFWRSFAGWYTTHVEKGTTKLNIAMLPFLELEADSVVLETACGGGNGIEVLLASTPATQIIGTDFSETMLEIARSKLGEGVNLQQADNQALPFEDSSFSHYISNLSLHVVPDSAKMLAEAFRVLRPGGLCAVSVLGKENFFAYLCMKVEASCRSRGLAPQEPKLLRLADPIDVLRLISEAGFIQPLYFSEFHQYPLKSPQAVVDLISTLPAVTALKTASPEHYQEVLEMMTRDVEAHIIGKSKAFELEGVIFIMRKPTESLEH